MGIDMKKIITNGKSMFFNYQQVGKFSMKFYIVEMQTGK